MIVSGLKIIDNHQNGTVADELRSKVSKDSKLSILSAFFSIYAYADLKKELDKVRSARFIFSDPIFARNETGTESREFSIRRNSIRSLGGSEFEMRLRNEMKQSAIARECAEWLRSKAEIRSLKASNPAQLRLIHIDSGDNSVSISGTVDFTADGLGITPSSRIDQNVCMYGKENTQAFLTMFNGIWNDSQIVEDVKDKVLEQLNGLYKENPPEFIYFMTLYNVFHQYLDELTDERIVKAKTGFKDTLVWKKLYKFQRDGVMGAIDKIERYNGCIIADSVGLGKTFTALAVIKYYELRNDRVLVLAPKKLRENWSIYTQNDTRNIFAQDRFGYDVLNHTDLSRTSGMSGDINLSTLNWSNYDLVVIDESHNFRNNPPVKDRITRYERLLRDVIMKGVKTKVLMLSATPVNNRMNDIKNQIYFITEGNAKALESAGITDIEQVLRKAQLAYNKWTELPTDERTTERFVRMMELDYFKLLDTLTIARSRKHIQKYYNLAEIGTFPSRLKPINTYPEIDITGAFPPIGEINLVIKKLNLGIYKPVSYILPEKRAEYARKYDVAVKDGSSLFTQADREQSLVELVRVGLLKRMESSIHSFRLTTEKIAGKIRKALALIDAHEAEYNPDLRIEEVDFDDPELESLLFGNTVKVLLQDMDLIKWRQDLERDYAKLDEMFRESKEISPAKDNKLAELMNVIDEKLTNPINQGNKKILVFTAFADTARYLYENISKRLLEKGIASALVTGSNENASTLEIPKQFRNDIRISDLNTVLTLFSPVSKERRQVFPTMTGEIDILFATDCISEGQNLQDCDCVVNYDIHWNPVRIIQRFGRIDRIGSRNERIQLVNFWPMRDLDAYINLQQRVQGRMVLLDVSATGEENLIDENQTREMQDLEYRKKQLERLQNEVVDLEEISGGISITDLTFNDFKTELMEYLQENRKALSEAPTGIYAVTDIDDSISGEVEPGILFTLRQLEGREQTKEQNPLFPYYLVYVTTSGKVRYTFLESKRILDILKKLCSGKSAELNALVNEFNQETDNGHKMSACSELLETAILAIIGKKTEIGVASLFSKGGTTLQTELYNGIEDFELVNFLVIR